MARSKPEKLASFLPGDEAERLLRGTRRERDRLLLMCGLYLGLRCAEALALRIEHLNFLERLLLVFCGKGGKQRRLPIPKRLIGPLRGFIGARANGYVFLSSHGRNKPLTTRAARYIVKRAAVVAGMDGALEPRRYHFHRLRHTFASRMLDRGATIVEVQEALGHSSVATTSTYAHAFPEHLRAAMEI